MFFTVLEESLTSSILPAAFPMSEAVSAASSALSTVLPRSIISSALDTTLTIAPPLITNGIATAIHRRQDLPIPKGRIVSNNIKLHCGNYIILEIYVHLFIFNIM